MLSDEEKKAIEIIKFLQEKCLLENGRGMMPIYRIDDLANAIETLLNLIEKQSKEIEELKDEYNTKLLSNAGIYQLGFKDGKDSVKNKIKAKIEELENEKEKYFEKQVIQHEIEILQSLLEKE